MVQKRTNTEKDMLINEIIDREFAMFDKVNGMHGRASCQDDFDTFYIMRFSQHNLFSFASLYSYLSDLQEAKAKGENLITNKYSYMMEKTHKEYFETSLKPFLPEIDAEKKSAISNIVRIFKNAYDKMYPLYPNIFKSGRELSSKEEVSVLSYLSSELKTYSKRTLLLIEKDCLDMDKSFINPLKYLYQNIAFFYGFQSLEEFESIFKNNNHN